MEAWDSLDQRMVVHKNTPETTICVVHQAVLSASFPPPNASKMPRCGAISFLSHYHAPRYLCILSCLLPLAFSSPTSILLFSHLCERMADIRKARSSIDRCSSAPSTSLLSSSEKTVTILFF